MEIGELRRALEEQAALEESTVIRDAYREAGRLRREAEAAHARALAHALVEAERSLRLELEQALARRRREAVRRVLGAREEALEAIRRRALERIGERSGSADLERAALRRWRRALRYVSPPVVVECAPPLAGKLAAVESAERPTRVVARPELVEGFRVLRPDGSVRVEGTLESELERSWPRLRIALLRRMGARP